MRYLLALLLSLGVLRGAAIDATAILDGEDSSDGTTITGTIMGNMIHNDGDWPAGSWSVTGSEMEIDNGEKTTIGSFLVNSVTYDDASGTRSMSVQNFGNDNNFVEYSFSGGYAGDISVGFWFYYPTYNSAGDWPDIFNIENVSGGWAVPQIQEYDAGGGGAPSDTVITMHTGGGDWSTDPDGEYIVIEENTWYWLTMVARRNGGNCELKVYADDGTLVGTSDHTPSPNITGPWKFMRFGRVDQHGSSSYTGAAHYDDIVVDFDDATFPLGPGTPPSGDPVYASATIPSAGTTMSVAFTEAVTRGGSYNDSQLTMSMSGGAVSPTYSSGDGTSTIVYTLSRTVDDGETGTTTYTQPGNGLEASDDGADVVTWTTEAVVNNSTQGQVATPSISPTVQLQWPNVTVTLTDNEGGASLYYVTDGTTPDSGDTLYSAPFILADGQFDLRVIAIKGGSTDSAIATQLYDADEYDLSTSWQSVAVTSQTGNFDWTFDVTPSVSSGHDTVVTMSETAPTSYDDNAILVRFDAGGNVDVRNGANYGADATFPYTADVTYNILVECDMNANTYDVSIKPSGGAYTKIADNYLFRESQPDPASLGYVGWIEGTVNTALLENISYAGSTPEFSSAEIASGGDDLILAFSETVEIGSGGNGGVTITPSGGASTATYASGDGTSALVYSLSRTIAGGETVTVSYVQPGDGIEATDDQTDVASFTDEPVANAAAESDPYWVSTTGAATWVNAQSATPLAGAACASIATMNSNASAGDTVYIRGGTTDGAAGQINLSNDGTALNPIIIEVYQSELFTIQNRTPANGEAIALTDRDYITLRKIQSNDCQESVDLDNCTYIRFENCVFLNHKNQTDGYPWPIAITLHSGTKYCTFTNVTAGACGYRYGPASPGGTDAGGVVDLAVPRVTPSSDDTSYNLFINCFFYRGGHHVVQSFAHNNYFVGTHFYNDEWLNGGLEGNRCVVLERGEYGDHSTPVAYYGSETFYGCTFFRSASPTPDANGVSIISVRTQRNRLIRNVFVDGSEGGLNINANDSNSLTADDNHAANNTMVHNGRTTHEPLDYWKGAVTMSIWGSGTSVANNEFKNNLHYDNFQDYGIMGVNINNQVFANNWLETDGDPLFVDYDEADLDPTNPNAHDFNLQSDSSCIDNGGYLTTISTATGSGTSFVVADSYWFFDGDGITDGAVIQIEDGTTELTVTDVNYSTHTITFTPSTSWTVGKGVAYAYSGSAPDQGAFEFTQGEGTTVIEAIRGVTVVSGKVNLE